MVAGRCSQDQLAGWRHFSNMPVVPHRPVSDQSQWWTFLVFTHTHTHKHRYLSLSLFFVSQIISFKLEIHEILNLNEDYERTNWGIGSRVSKQHGSTIKFRVWKTRIKFCQLTVDKCFVANEMVRRFVTSVEGTQQPGESLRLSRKCRRFSITFLEQWSPEQRGSPALYQWI